MADRRSVDVIVVGMGGMGSAAAYHLSRRGMKVLGLEQFELGHSLGSSHGETRVIRAAYFEHPDYVPLLRRSYELWNELEIAAKRTLFHRVGVLVSGAPEGTIRQGLLASADQHGISVETFSEREAKRRFPQFQFPEGHLPVLEPDAGYLEVENCVLEHLRLARENGAIFRSGEKLLAWKVQNGMARVQSSGGTYEAPKLLFTTGAWIGTLLRDFGIPFRALRKRLYWFKAGDEFGGTSGATPCYLFDTANGVYYGFPKIDSRGVKVAEHSGGEALESPDELNRPSRGDLTGMRRFLNECMPSVSALAPTQEKLCLYEMTPDEHFLVDRHPEHEGVWFAGGFSGHGFKFASVMGEILADLTIEGGTRHPIEFLRMSRLQRPEKSK